MSTLTTTMVRVLLFLKLTNAVMNNYVLWNTHILPPFTQQLVVSVNHPFCQFLLQTGLVWYQHGRTVAVAPAVPPTFPSRDFPLHCTTSPISH